VSKKSSARFLVVLLSVALATAALVFADLCVFAQDTSGGTTQNANAAKPKTSHRRRRSTRRRHRGAAAASSAAAATPANTGGEQTDLSGTYTGTINCMSMTGDATLTINGNQFTLSGASSGSGRITAETTRGYTGATLRFDAAGGGTPTSVSVRAKKSGDRLWLTPVPGEMNKCSFTPSGGGTRGMRHTRRGRRGAAATPAATDTTTTTGDTSATPATGDTTTPATTTPRRHRAPRRSRRGTSTNANSNAGGGNTNSTPPQF